MNGPGGEKTQPTGTTLEEVELVDVEEVELLEVVETTLEDVVLDELDVSVLEVVELEVVEVAVGPSNLRAMLAPRAITTTTRTAEATTILPIPLREVFTIIIARTKEASYLRRVQGLDGLRGTGHPELVLPCDDHPAGATTGNLYGMKPMAYFRAPSPARRPVTAA